MKGIKKISIVLALVMLLGTLAACGGSGVSVTYHYNADELKDETVTKEPDSRLTLESPEREGYALLGWYTDEALTQPFASGTKVSEDIDLYAKWGQAYVLEAEYVDLSGFHGQGFSGGCDGAQAIAQDKSDLGASNGVFLTYMYNQGLSITFTFTSDAAVSDATVILRLSAEIMDISFTSSDFTVALNGTALGYSTISLTENQPFADYVVGTDCTLNAGTNTITLTTTNSTAMAGTMYATAPIIDCVKLVTSAGIEMEEHRENMDKFSMD